MAPFGSYIEGSVISYLSGQGWWGQTFGYGIGITNKIKVVREQIRTVQSRQKSYADKWRSDLSFDMGDFVFIKMSFTRYFEI